METKIRDFIRKNDRLGLHLGIELLDVQSGYAKTKLVIRDCHLNGVGVVHGGTIFTLADIAFAAASNSHGTVALAIHVDISYLRGVREGTLYAEAKEVSCTPKLGSYDIKVTNEKDELIALFQGMAYRKKEPILPS
jgi:acyl-CoA thioesterase